MIAAAMAPLHRSVSVRRRSLRVLGLEPFDRGSHGQVRRIVEARSRHAWRFRTRPGRGWAWRMRLAGLELGLEEADAATAAGRAACLPGPDVVVASSLMNLAECLGVAPPGTPRPPAVLVMHENQAAYPDRSGAAMDPGSRDVHFALVDLASMLAADRVVWNSSWNRDSFLAAMPRLLRPAPDVDARGLLARVEARSVVLPPPVEDPLAGFDAARRRAMLDRPLAAVPRICWPHRWEHDKGPDELLAVADGLVAAGVEARWVLLGERFAAVPPALEAFLERHASRIEQAGRIDDPEAYRRRLADCDWVLSTARHEFFGIAVAEAMLAGCLPWLPMRLSYPELVPAAARGLEPATPPADPAAVRRAGRRHLLDRCEAGAAVGRLDALLEEVVADGRSRAAEGRDGRGVRKEPCAPPAEPD